MVSVVMEFGTPEDNGLASITFGEQSLDTCNYI